MKLSKLITFFIVFWFFIACTINPTKSTQKDMINNPLLSQWETPFGVPPFDQIKNEHYLPAFYRGIEAAQKEIDLIATSVKTPSFKNTIEAFELSGSLLTTIRKVFYAVNGANTNDKLKNIAKEIAPKLAAHRDNIMLNEKLFQRVKTVYDQKENLDLTAEENKLLEETYKSFVRAGANVIAGKKERLREINAHLATLAQQFGENVLDETNSFELYVDAKKDLGNLSEGLCANASEEAKRRGRENGWLFTLQRPSINPFLVASPNRNLRKRIFDGYALRGANNNKQDNKAIVSEMVSLRVEKAKLLGFDTHADYVLSNSMAKTPKAVLDFLDKLWSPALEMAKSERTALADKMKSEGVNETFRGSDWRYYVEKVRKERYDFNEEETRPYFEFTAVLQGAFTLANKLFGLQFVKKSDIPIWHKDQQVFEVLEADGTHVGILYMDFFARESKRGGAWMNSLRSQSKVAGKMITPIITNNFNFPAPTKDTPSLLSFSEAQTVFHEFGHGLHGLLSDVTYESLSGTNVPRDFVEFPSQVMENWMSQPEMLQLYAKHYKTGEVIPMQLVNKMNEAAKFNQGFATVEYMAAAYLDMYWHSISDTDKRDVHQFENEMMRRIDLIEEILPRYKSTYFQHIFSGGYSSAYYSYLWSEVLDADAFAAFTETGDIFNPEIAKKYRTLISKGGTEDGMELYKAFRGRAPKITSLLAKKGF